jgi:hypothetical protein
LNQVDASNCSAAGSAASVGGVLPRRFPLNSAPRTGTGTVPKLAGEDACATIAPDFVIPGVQIAAAAAPHTTALRFPNSHSLLITQPCSQPFSYFRNVFAAVACAESLIAEIYPLISGIQ